MIAIVEIGCKENDKVGNKANKIECIVNNYIGQAKDTI